MKKILLFVCSMLFTVAAMAQSKLEFTFDRNNGNPIITSTLDGSINNDITASITISPDGYLPVQNRGADTNKSEEFCNSVLAINRNTTAATQGDPNCYILTISGLGNCTFTGITVSGVAVNSNGQFQPMNTNRNRNFIIGYGSDGDNMTYTEPALKSICDDSHCNGAPTNHTFTVEGTANGNLVIKVQIYTDGGQGCFYGLTSISIDGLTIKEESEPTPVAAFYHLTGKNLTAAELMAKKEPTYIAIKGIANSNRYYFNYVSGQTNTSVELFNQSAVFVWEPTDEDGKFYLKKLENGYMQKDAPGNFAETTDNAVVFEAVKPSTDGTGHLQCNRDGINGDPGTDYYVRFVATNKDETCWLTLGAYTHSAQAVEYTTTRKGTVTFYQICELKGFDENVNITIKNTGDVDYATFYFDAPLVMPEGVTAYSINTIESGYVTLNEVPNGIVPANTGVVLAANVDENTEFEIGINGADVAAIEANKLRGTTTDTYVEGAAYVLANGKEGIGLYAAELNKNATGEAGNTHFKNNANKAYLPVAEGASLTAAFYGFNWNGTTGVENVEVENEVKAIYDLTGRKVETISAPGIYIINGVKRVVR